MKKYLITLFFLITFSYINTANSNLNELAFSSENKTIRELKENIDDLNYRNSLLENDFKLLNSDYKLKGFLKEDLTKLQFNMVKKVVSKYSLEKNNIENKIEENLKHLKDIKELENNFLWIKKDFYIWLMPYIKNSSKNEYLEYIKSDIEILNKQNDLNTNIIVKKEVLNTKISSIEEKIKEHKEYINENIANIANETINKKIENIANNSSFIELNTQSKIKIIEQSIVKIRIKLQNNEKWFNNSWSLLFTSDLNNMNENIYIIAINALESFKNSLIISE